MDLSPAEMARWLDRFADRLEDELMQADREFLGAAKKAAVGFSQGPHSTLQLIEWEHPYGLGPRIFRSRVTPVYIINKQTGVFSADWTSVGPFYSGGELVSQTMNTAWYSGFMRGTTRMIERPILDQVALMTYNTRVWLHEAHATRAMR